MGNLARELRPRRGDHELLQGGVDAVGGHHDVGGGAGPVGEGEGGLVLSLLEADALVAGVDDGRGKLVDEEGEQIGAVEAVELDCAGELRRPHGSGEGAVRATELGIDPASGVAGDAVAETQRSQHAHAIGLDSDAGADLSEGWRLLVEVHVDAATEESEGGGDTADAATDDSDARSAHRIFLSMAPLSYSVEARRRPPAISNRASHMPASIAATKTKVDVLRKASAVMAGPGQ